MAIEVKISNPEKVYWPNEGITKGEMIEYYRRISPYLFPYLKNRPQSLHRFPEGINGMRFYQKNVDHMPPQWVATETIYSSSNEETVNYITPNNKETIIYMANLGCIEMNPWSSRVGSLEKPDYSIIDLDPEEISFSEVIKAAQKVHEVLESLGVKSYPKTSGKTGIHIYIPLGAKYTYEQSKNFAHLVVMKVHELLSKTTSLERLPKKRQGKVYLDYLQNNIGATLAAPYSLRPVVGVPVATPLFWEEVKKELNPKDFNIKTIFDRVGKIGDIFEPVLKEKTDILAVLKKLEG